ncbi:O-antigen ligase family protein [Calditrichota bacterium]
MGCTLGLLVGIAFVRFSPILVLGMLVAIIFISAAPKRPEIALLGMLIATSSIVFEEKLPIISTGIGSFHIPDIILLGLLGLIVMRRFFDPGFRFVHTPLDWPLLIFFSLTLLSTFIALYQSSVEFETARRAIRVLSYYLTFFIVTNLVRDRRQLNFLLNGFFLLATIVAVGMIGQFLLGDSVNILPGRVESLSTQGVLFEDIVRIAPPGFSIVLVSFVTILCTLVLEKFKPHGLLKFLQCGLLGIALLITFLRSYWAVLFLILFLLLYILRGDERPRFIGWGLVILFTASMSLLIVLNNPGSRVAKLVEASMHRLSTLVNSRIYQDEDTYGGWRKIENEYAFNTITSNPWIGLGMGAKYRPLDSRLDYRSADGVEHDFRGLIHNSHLTIMLQSGLIGYTVFIWISLIFLIRGFKYWRSVANKRLRGIMLGFTLVYLAILIAAIANSTFMQWRWTPVIGIIMGINEVLLRNVDKAQQ